MHSRLWADMLGRIQTFSEFRYDALRLPSPFHLSNEVVGNSRKWICTAGARCYLIMHTLRVWIIAVCTCMHSRKEGATLIM